MPIKTPFGLDLHPMGTDALHSWIRKHRLQCAKCRNQVSGDDHKGATGNTPYIHFLRGVYASQLSAMTELSPAAVNLLLEALEMIPVSAPTFNRRRQEIDGAPHKLKMGEDW